MEKLKKCLNNPKNATIIALIGSCIFLLGIIYSFVYPTVFCFTVPDFIGSLVFTISIILYFGVVFFRLKGKQIKIEWSKKLVIFSLVVMLTFNIIRCLIKYALFYETVFELIYNTILTIFLIGLFTEKKYISNNIFLIVTIMRVIIFIAMFSNFLIDVLIYSIFVLSVTPYFYIYYNLIGKGEQ